MRVTSRIQSATREKLHTAHRPLPKSWLNAVGILKSKKIDPLGYQKDIRKGWATRLKKLAGSSW